MSTRDADHGSPISCRSKSKLATTAKWKSIEPDAGATGPVQPVQVGSVEAIGHGLEDRETCQVQDAVWQLLPGAADAVQDDGLPPGWSAAPGWAVADNPDHA